LHDNVKILLILPCILLKEYELCQSIDYIDRHVNYQYPLPMFVTNVNYICFLLIWTTNVHNRIAYTLNHILLHVLQSLLWSKFKVNLTINCFNNILKCKYICIDVCCGLNPMYKLTKLGHFHCFLLLSEFFNTLSLCADIVCVCIRMHTHTHNVNIQIKIYYTWEKFLQKFQISWLFKFIWDNV
jgi:hypothetical protein